MSETSCTYYYSILGGKEWTYYEPLMHLTKKVKGWSAHTGGTKIVAELFS